MNILVITDVLWRNDNGVGNSYSNIFSGMPEVEVANICCQEGKSHNNISSLCYQISEARLVANLRNRNIPTGIVENLDDDIMNNCDSGKSNKFFQFLRRTRLQALFWARDLIWKVGRWETNELNNFIDSFEPDLIFAQLQDKVYLNDIVKYIKNYTKCPMVLYVWDDVYSLKQFSLSPLFWIDRFYQRASIRSLVRCCSKLYTISIEQEMEYKKTLKINTGILYKGKQFTNRPSRNNPGRKILKMLYTGNLYSGRYQTLLKICNIIKNCNKSGLKVQLEIYSGTNLSEHQVAKLNIPGSSFFKGAVSEEMVSELQKDADVLLHIEPMSLKGSLLCRLSFSTKLVDYFYKGKCIFAVGSKRCASMRYLNRNDAAITSTSIKEAENKLCMLLKNKELIREYSEKSWDCGVRNHQIYEIQKKLKADFEGIIRKSNL